MSINGPYVLTSSPCLTQIDESVSQYYFSVCLPFLSVSVLQSRAGERSYDPVLFLHIPLHLAHKRDCLSTIFFRVITVPETQL